VATRVGYSSFAAFTEAFHKQFGVPPSEIKRGDSQRVMLPPDGDPRRTRRKRRRL
jgi:AraC-like DNA-binding protein